MDCLSNFPRKLLGDETFLAEVNSACDNFSELFVPFCEDYSDISWLLCAFYCLPCYCMFILFFISSSTVMYFTTLQLLIL